jgi:hypothetical protein
MSAYSGSFGIRAGFNQNGGNYYMILSTITPENWLSYNSNGFIPYTGLDNYSTPVEGAGKIIKDMGKTIVSSGRLFRKFQQVGAASLSTSGVIGNSGLSGFITGYLELPAANGGGYGADNSSGNLIVRL